VTQRRYGRPRSDDLTKEIEEIHETGNPKGFRSSHPQALERPSQLEETLEAKRLRHFVLDEAAD
jgi:hypothetical protein